MPGQLVEGFDVGGVVDADEFVFRGVTCRDSFGGKPFCGATIQRCSGCVEAFWAFGVVAP